MAPVSPAVSTKPYRQNASHRLLMVPLVRRTGPCSQRAHDDPSREAQAAVIVMRSHDQWTPRVPSESAIRVGTAVPPRATRLRARGTDRAANRCRPAGPDGQHLKGPPVSESEMARDASLPLCRTKFPVLSLSSLSRTVPLTHTHPPPCAFPAPRGVEDEGRAGGPLSRCCHGHLSLSDPAHVRVDPHVCCRPRARRYCSRHNGQTTAN